MPFVNLGKRCPQTWRPLLHRVRNCQSRPQTLVSHHAKAAPRFRAPVKKPSETAAALSDDHMTPKARALEAMPEPWKSVHIRLNNIEQSLGIESPEWPAT